MYSLCVQNNKSISLVFVDKISIAPHIAKLQNMLHVPQFLALETTTASHNLHWLTLLKTKKVSFDNICTNVNVSTLIVNTNEIASYTPGTYCMGL